MWVVLRPTDRIPPYDVLAVTADPAEGEAMTEAGNDLVETVSMPPSIAEALEAFLTEHHVERPFFRYPLCRCDLRRDGVGQEFALTSIACDVQCLMAGVVSRARAFGNTVTVVVVDCL